jgi:hypothetical protein
MSLLAFMIFHDEFDTSFRLMFGFLLFIKSFHWLASDRIEWVRLSSIPPLSVSWYPYRWTKGLIPDLHSFFISGWLFFFSFCGQPMLSCSYLQSNTPCRLASTEWFFSLARYVLAHLSPNIRNWISLQVWYISCQPHEYRAQILLVHVWPSSGRPSRWRKRTSLGQQEHVDFLHWINDW